MRTDNQLPTYASERGDSEMDPAKEAVPEVEVAKAEGVGRSPQVT